MKPNLPIIFTILALSLNSLFLFNKNNELHRKIDFLIEQTEAAQTGWKYSNEKWEKSNSVTKNAQDQLMKCINLKT